MAKIVRKQEVELGLEELISLVKKNWGLIAGFFTCNFSDGNKIIVEACFNLAGINKALCQTEGLIADENELEEAITQIFREIEHQNPHFKNMAIEFPAPYKSLGVSFEIDIAPVMPVKEPPSPLTTALFRNGGNPDKVRHIAGENPVGEIPESDDPFLGIGRT